MSAACVDRRDSCPSMPSRSDRPPLMETTPSKEVRIRDAAPRVLRDGRARDAHRDADVRLLERRRVVHPITRHGDDVADALAVAHDDELLLRACTCKDDLRVREDGVPLRDGVIITNLPAGDDDGLGQGGVLVADVSRL